MKYTIFILTFLVASIGFAQDSTVAKKVTPPKMVTKLHFGASVQFEDIRLKFVAANV